MHLKIKRLFPDRDADIPLPSYATDHSSGLDLRASADVSLLPGDYGMILTGLAIEIPEGYEGQVRPRSGLAAKHGVTCLNTPGTIDADYRGEVKVILINHGKQVAEFKRGERIAQLIIAKYEKVEILEVDELADTSRGEGGFGHTGRG
ncbi:MAG TPA: dUTP diphosphatase [Candidatus Kapabacteria bacterium]|nr:dUTP diphosphatase [Candidatus Kapabacteria bacterium]